MNAGFSPSPTPPAWTDPELANPHAEPGKADKVRSMFSAIAPSYDLNNRLHSLWQDQRWRRKAVRLAAVQPGDQVLDVACGTGDLTQLFAKTKAARVMGVDFTPAMLDIAKVKSRRLSASVSSKVQYQVGDAQKLPFSNSAFDVVSIAFGIRNVAEPSRALAEFHRLLKPGGRLVILEFSTPSNRLMRWFNGVYCGKVMPWSATLISGDASGAYKYLPASVGTFWGPQEMLESLEIAGFTEVTQTAMSLGICSCYRAIRR